MRSNSIPVPVLTARVLHLHSSCVSLCLDAFSPSEPNLFPFTSLLAWDVSPLWNGCCLCFVCPSIHPSIRLRRLSSLAFQLAGHFSFPSIILAHKTSGGGRPGCVFRAGYTAMGALTRTNAIHAPHLLARSYEKGWPRQLLWDT